jgi:hypothetical protein
VFSGRHSCEITRTVVIVNAIEVVYYPPGRQALPCGAFPNKDMFQNSLIPLTRSWMVRHVDRNISSPRTTPTTFPCIMVGSGMPYMCLHGAWPTTLSMGVDYHTAIHAQRPCPRIIPLLIACPVLTMYQLWRFGMAFLEHDLTRLTTSGALMAGLSTIETLISFQISHTQPLYHTMDTHYNTHRYVSCPLERCAKESWRTK